MEILESIYDQRLARLEALQGTDPGFFTLAVHSFVEGTLRERYGLDDVELNFQELVRHFIQDCKNDGKGAMPELSAVSQLLRAHYETNDIRHKFFFPPRLSAEVATQHLESFCKTAGIGSQKRLATIRNFIAAWDRRESFGALLLENKEIRKQLQLADKECRELTQEVSELVENQQLAEQLLVDIKSKDRKISDLEKTSGDRSARIDTLRAERAQDRATLSDAQKRIRELEKAQSYLDAMRRMTVFTRSRADYEKMIIRLTPEQQTILSHIHLNADFLIKGAAGTGKTIVLLKAIEKAKTDPSPMKVTVALVTFTRTLVKYDAYLAAILSTIDQADIIATVDQFLFDRLCELAPGYRTDGRILENLCTPSLIPDFTPTEIAKEIEDFIWCNDVGYEEYILQKIDRTGMRTPIRANDREKIWRMMQVAVATMEEAHVLAYSYVPVKLLRLLEASPKSSEVRYFDYIFIDEAQDLSAAAVKALKKLAVRCILLAGDADQSIYKPGFSYARSGIEVSGRTRILKTNFRNTVPIHALAESFRHKSLGNDLETAPIAFREGPEPELICASGRKDLMGLLESRLDFFLTHLGYDAENICILAPRNSDLADLTAYLKSAGHAVAHIKDDEFRFDQQAAVRMCTLHSAKGLDFPVVLLYVPEEPHVGADYDQSVTDKMIRNLLYVGITRSMDHLNVLTLRQSESKAIQDLIEVFSNFNS